MDIDTRRLLLATTAMTAWITTAGAQNLPPGATPQGGAVVGGIAAIHQAPGATTITQTSQRAAIDWRSFNVGAKASVTFRQPNANAIALNRVVSPDASRIEGRISANGQVVLINQSGVVFTKTARVDAQSLVVSASNISNQHFMAGDLRFDQPPRPGARIVNRGHITLKQAGLAAFVAPQVANKGVITARLGHVVLAGADAFTLDLYGDRLISLDVTKAVRAVDLGGRRVTALVTNRGVIAADGGTITLTASQADALVQNVLDVGGTLRADTVGQSKGSITIAGVGGDIQIAGNLLARGNHGAGGSIGVNTDGRVNVGKTAMIDASGVTHGGVIALGTSIERAEQGQSDTAAPRAAHVAIARGARVTADATRHGDGGTITLLSHDRTDQAGALSAASVSGHGGLIEISSDGIISLSGTETALSLGGHPGEILLDPATLVIGTGTPAATILDGAIIGTDSNTTSYIDPSILATLGGVVELGAGSLIAVNSPVTNSNALAMVLDSRGAVSIGAAISVSGVLEINAVTGISIGAPLTAGAMTLIDTGPGSGITEIAGGAIITALLNGSVAGGSALFTNSDNQVGRLAGFTVAEGDLALADGVKLTVTGSVSANNIALTDPAGIDVSGVVQAANGGTISLIADQLASGEAGQVLAPSGVIALAPYTNGAPFDPSPLIPILGTASILNIGSLAGHEAGALSISQPIGNFPALSLTATGVITNTASLSAQTISVNGGSIALDAPVTAAAALDLISGTGVSQTAPVTTALLTGVAAGGDAVLTNADNMISTLGSFSVADGALDLADSGLLAVSGPVGAQSASLTAPDIALGGLLTVTNALSLSSQYGIAESGAAILDAGTFSGSAAGGSIDLPNPGNQIATAGDVSAASSTFSSELPRELPDSFGGDFILGDGVLLNITGRIAVNTLALADPYGIGESGGGAISATELTAFGPTGNVSLIGAGNAVATLGAFTVNGDFGFADASPLTVAGAVSANNITLIDAASLDLANSVSTAPLGQLDLIANQLDVSGGTILAPAGTVALAPFTSGNPVDLGGTSLQPGTLALAPAVLSAIQGENTLVIGDAATHHGGAVDVTAPVSFAVPRLVLDGQGIGFAAALGTTGTLVLNSSAGVTETGAITAASLSGTTTGNVALGGTANAIQSLGAFTATGNLDLMDAMKLTIDGPVLTQNAAIAANGITFAGNVATGDLALGSTNGISQTSGVITAASLASIGTIAGPVNLGDANAIGTLANFITDAALSLNDGAALVLAGAVDAADLALSANGITFTGTVAVPGAVALGSSNGVIEAGGAITAATLISTGTITGAAVLDGANSIAELGDFASTGDFALTDQHALAVTGTASASDIALSADGIGIGGALLTSGNLALTSGDGVTEAGRIIAATLSSGGIIGGAVLNGTNRIASLGVFPINGGKLVLRDGTKLTIAGPVAAPDAAFIAPALDLAGVIDVAGITTLNGASITQSDGLIHTGTLAGTAASTVSFGRGNLIGTLGDFIVQNGQFILNDTMPLTVTGPVAANAVSLSSAGGMMLQGVPGGGLFIGGSYALGAPGAPRQGIDSLLRVSGQGILNFVQTGDFEINGGSGAYTNHQSSLFIALAANGRASFTNLIAPSTELFLDLGGGTGKGRLDLARLVVVGGEPGQVSFTGILDNVGGEAAAHNGLVVPVPESNFVFNGCVIGSVSCIVIPIEAVPAGNPLRNFAIGRKRRRELPHDVHLPGITSRDF